MKRFKIRRVDSFDIARYISFTKMWMFISKDFNQIEICDPTLENIEFMSRNGFKYVIKGFKSRVEFREFDQLAFKIGMSSFKFTQHYIGNKVICDAINSILSGNEMPSAEDIQNGISNNCLFDMSNKQDVERRKQTKIYYNRYIGYVNLLKKRLNNLVKDNRVNINKVII